MQIIAIWYLYSLLTIIMLVIFRDQEKVFFYREINKKFIYNRSESIDFQKLFALFLLDMDRFLTML